MIYFKFSVLNYQLLNTLSSLKLVLPWLVVTVVVTVVVPFPVTCVVGKVVKVVILVDEAVVVVDVVDIVVDVVVVSHMKLLQGSCSNTDPSQ